MKEKTKEKIEEKINSNAKFALTTFDNPFSPFSDYKNWLQFDTEKARREQCANSSSLLARFAMVSSEMSEQQYNSEVERAIDQIVKSDMTNTYVKATNPDYKEQ